MCLSMYLSMHLCLSSMRLMSTYVFLCLSMFLFVFLFVSICILCLSYVYSMYLSMYLRLSMSIYVYQYVSMSLYVSLYLSMGLCVHLCLSMSLYVSACHQKNFSMVHESSIRCSPAPSVPAIEAVLLLYKYFCLGKLVHPLLWKSYLLFFSLILCLLICHFGSFTLIQW